MSATVTTTSNTGTINTGFPQAPFVDPETGDIAMVWRMFLVALWKRSGASIGVNLGDIVAALAAETAARVALAARVVTLETANATLQSEVAGLLALNIMLREG